MKNWPLIDMGSFLDRILFHNDYDDNICLYGANKHKYFLPETTLRHTLTRYFVVGKC